MRAVSLLVVLALLSSGCASSAPTTIADGTGLPVMDLLLLSADASASATEGLRWKGPELWIDGEREHRFPFTWSAPTGFWDSREGWLEISIAWNTREGISYDFLRPNNRLNLRVEDSAGKIIAKRDHFGAAGGAFGLPAAPGPADRAPQFSFVDPYSVALLVPKLAPGDYVAVVSVYEGRAAYEGVVQLEVAPPKDPPTDLLPNIVTVPPLDVVIDYPPLWDVADPDLRPLGIRGCSAEEFVFKSQPRRCLRFSNAIGNAGPGPFIVVMKEPIWNSVAQERPMFQVVKRSDGTFRDRPAGTGQFHAHHFHTHYLPISEFALYKYDLEAKARGERVTKIVKNGFAPLDEGLLQLGLPATAGAGSCSNGVNAEWTLCISSNWYDMYELDRYENYVEISGVADGVYELVSKSNPQGLLEETRLDDNEGTAILRLTGDRVDVLERHWGLAGEPAIR